jgi:hypothetical protein
VDGPVDFLDSLDVVVLDGRCPAGAGGGLFFILTSWAVGSGHGRHLVIALSGTRVVSHTGTEKQWRRLLIVYSGHEVFSGGKIRVVASVLMILMRGLNDESDD